MRPRLCGQHLEVCPQLGVSHHLRVTEGHLCVCVCAIVVNKSVAQALGCILWSYDMAHQRYVSCKVCVCVLWGIWGPRCLCEVQ